MCCALFSIAAKAQTDTSSKELISVTITGSKKILFDPALRPRLELGGDNRALSQTLLDQNIVFLKTYGPGLLSSISSRGSDPTHTPILWNGFSLQNVVNANPDPAIETVPANYRAAYYPGGQSGLFGSGAMGGTIHLGPSFVQKEGISLHAGFEFGSFGRHSQTGNIGFQNDKTSFAAGLRLYKAQNNFQFVNRAVIGKPIQRLQHAEANGTSVNFDLKRTLKKAGEVTGSLWYQFNRRQIPPTMISSVGKAEQVDENVRSMFGWNKTFASKHHLAIKTAFLYDFLFYNDDALTTPSLMVQYSSLSRAEYDYSFLKNHHIFIGLNHSYYKVFMEEYHGFSPQRNQTTFFIGYKYALPKNLGEVAAQAVEEFTDRKFAPFCPAFSALVRPVSYLPIRMRVNRNFRQPTFNDLYWIPGGNPNLKAEQGFSQEAGIGFEKKYNKPSGEYGVSIFGTGFHSVTTNRIVWTPGPIYWSPENIDKTRAYGAETDMKLHWKKNKFSASFSANYSFTKSIRDKERFEGDPTYKKQLIYIPMHLGGAGIEFAYHRTAVFYRHRFTGTRYTLADNSQSIPGFQTGNVGISQSFVVYGVTIQLWFTCENIANVAYEVLEYRPMPMRNYRGGITLAFNKNFK